MARAGTTAALDRPSGLLLGADDGARYPVVSPRLEVDDLVLLCTDGLVERRSGGADDLLGRVRRALSDLSALPGDEMLVRLPGLLHYASPDDGTCTLAVRVLP